MVELPLFISVVGLILITVCPLSWKIMVDILVVKKQMIKAKNIQTQMSDCWINQRCSACHPDISCHEDKEIPS